MAEHPLELGDQSAGPGGALGHLHAEHRLHGEDDADLVGEGRQPVVPVGQDEICRQSRTSKSFGAPVHVADDRFGGDDPLAVEDDAQPEHPRVAGCWGPMFRSCPRSQDLRHRLRQ